MHMASSFVSLVFVIVFVGVAVGIVRSLVRAFAPSAHLRFRNPAPAQWPGRSAPVNGSRACRNPACQAANPPAAQFCARCGHPV